ncbi:rhomboid family intramembrane serine protease [Natrialbaceae archaeon A-CW2]|uniref:rhomboid family intramembrane serine protease n=1 Tax=Natronosalvus amylolyticus TaxID=2961994 RepID=UPI0020C9D61B|nr:rhomboid family intramembrane serine protease [Natronosalvus amylolyticus]
MDWLGDVLAILVVATILASLVAVRRLSHPSHRWGDVLRSRLLFGVPWGTLVSIGFVLLIYLFVQDGITNFNRPVVKPFRAYSFFYPLGMLTAPFAHASASHLTGNLIGTLVIAPIAEYAWGHYPNERGSESFSGWWTNPVVRAFVIFPVAVIGIGILTSVFALGPVIGFSGVVFAFAGFAIVRYPIVTVIAAIGVQGTVSRIQSALELPIGVYVAQPRPPSPPSWATIAIQGHALGFFLGFLLALFVFRHRNYRPNPLYLWLAVLVYGFSKSLWAIYWFGGANEYILFQGPGVIAVTALALVATVAVVGSERSIVPPWLEHRLSRPTIHTTGRPLRRTLETMQSRTTALDVARIRTLVQRPKAKLPTAITETSHQWSAFVVVLVVVALITGPAIPVNLFVIGDGMADNEASVTVEGYTVEYAEGVQNPMASVVDLEAFDPEGVQSSGVIVSNPDRQLWTEAVSAQRLAFSGSQTIIVGGPGWRETVRAERQGWTPVGNDTVYQVWLDTGSERRHAFASDQSTANAQISGQNVTIAPSDGEFFLEVHGNDTETATVSIPEHNESVTANGLEFVRVDDELYVHVDDTIVQIASKESYN